MSKKKKSKADIIALMADNKWEQVHNENDRLMAERIKTLGGRSKVDVLIGGLLFFAGYSDLIDLIKIMQKNGKAAGAFSIHNMIKGIETNEFLSVALLIAAGMVFLFFAMSKNETIDKVTEARYKWMPNDAEIAYLEKRFDNDFVRSILSKISPVETRSIETGLEAVTVKNYNSEPEVFNYNKNGFRRLTNYDTKQLSYYLASHSFPEGFSIYQIKITPAGSEKCVSGMTEIGGDQPEQPRAKDEKAYKMKLLARVFEQLREFARVRNPFKMYLKESGPGADNNGQIVLNKGFKVDEEGYAEL